MLTTPVGAGMFAWIHEAALLRVSRVAMQRLPVGGT